MKKLRIGCIGTLHDHSAVTVQSLKELDEYFEVVGYVCESDSRYEEIKNDTAYKGLKRMTEKELLNSNLDAAVIEGFEKEQVHYAKLCVDKGIHVQIDKPAGDNIEEFKELLTEAKKKNLIVHMGYMYRYNPAVIKAKEIIKSGKLGEIYSIEAQMSCEHNLKKREWMGNFKGGMMFYLGCHLVDLIYSIQGLPEEIIPLNKAIANNINAEDFGMAVFNYKKGVSFCKTTSKEAGGFLRRQLVICGTKGTIEINPIERFVESKTGNMLDCDMRVTIGADIEHSWGRHGEKQTLEPFDRYKNMLVEFYKCVVGEIKNPYTFEYELRMQMLVLKACGFDIDYKQKIELYKGTNYGSKI